MPGKIMNLDEAQRDKVASWVAGGLKLSEIQSRLADELGIRMTYMEVRLLVDDLKLTPKDAERAEANGSGIGAGNIATSGKGSGDQPASAGSKESGSTAGDVSVSVDQLARPGAVVSGKVIFSDGNQADWYFDQTGRLGLAPQQQGYRPSPADLQRFQTSLEAELSRMGF